MVVLDDADIDRAVAGALWGAFANCGQVCAGIERIYVDRGLHDAFVDQLVGSASTLRIGDGRDPRTELGPVVQEAARERTETLIADAVEHGAHVVYGGNRPSLQLPGWFLEPTILLGEPEASRLAREEIFGPVATIVAVDDEREAVRRANESAFGLGASVWTRDRDRGRRLAGELRAGSVWVNDHAYSYGLGEAPWGGRGWSGVGRTHGPQGLLALSHVKFTDADAGRLTPAWWYPYSEGVLDGFRGVLGGLHGDGLAGRAGKLVEHRRGVAHLLRKVLR
jgi:acyl-CoA reductase-like NAD-dependent aldehyde dehydrogenase